jgi:CDP-glucose 4,6-dehydratase
MQLTPDETSRAGAETMKPYIEGDPRGGHDPYSSSKGCAEILTSSMRRSFFSDTPCLIASVRAVNGGGDWAVDRLIPNCIRAWTRGEPVRIRNTSAVRPWQHLLDPLSGYLRLAEALFAGRRALAKGWNFGPTLDAAWPVEKIAGAVTRNCRRSISSSSRRRSTKPTSSSWTPDRHGGNSIGCRTGRLKPPSRRPSSGTPRIGSPVQRSPTDKSEST